MSVPPRSRQARSLAEAALVRFVHACGMTPRVVLLGGLMPDFLCTRAGTVHIGTTDVDLQVDQEIAIGSGNAERLEAALWQAEFASDRERPWRWLDQTAPGAAVKVEFLTDLDDVSDHATVTFDNCEYLGAANLRGTGFAGHDWETRKLVGNIDGVAVVIEVRVAGLAGYLLAKAHAAYGRRATKDWYDIAYVLLHNDEGGPTTAGERVRDRFGAQLTGRTLTALVDLSSNFASPEAQGPRAYADTMLSARDDLDWDTLANDAVAAVAVFARSLDLDRRAT